MLSSNDLYKIDVEQRAINEVIGGTDENIAKFWELVGFPQKPGESQVVSLTIVLQNLAAAALSQPHPLGAKMSFEDLAEFLIKRQNFSDREVATLAEKVGVTRNDGMKRTFAGIVTRLVKAIVRPNVVQG